MLSLQEQLEQLLMQSRGIPPDQLALRLTSFFVDFLDDWRGESLAVGHSADGIGDLVDYLRSQSSRPPQRSE